MNARSGKYENVYVCFQARACARIDGCTQYYSDMSVERQSMRVRVNRSSVIQPVGIKLPIVLTFRRGAAAATALERP